MHVSVRGDLRSKKLQVEIYRQVLALFAGSKKITMNFAWRVFLNTFNYFLLMNDCHTWKQNIQIMVIKFSVHHRKLRRHKQP
mmetsp:Transcript_22341/g.29228  ORF Transcript_22341/g.29228 Transcript_22341/m.29228 type:complete len:82 (-) Transcript_22341:82-327(-)